VIAVLKMESKSNYLEGKIRKDLKELVRLGPVPSKLIHSDQIIIIFQLPRIR
jgi:hypothetical protein